MATAGTLTRDPELRFGNNGGKAYARFSIAVDHKDRNGEKTTSFYEVVCFGSVAENLAESLVKGNRVVVFGSQEIERYEDKDGNQRTKVVVKADEVGVDLRWAKAQVERSFSDRQEEAF